MGAINEFVPDISWSNGSGNTLGTITITNYSALVSLISSLGYEPEDFNVVLVRKCSTARMAARALHKTGVIDGRHQGSHNTYKYRRVLDTADSSSFTLTMDDLTDSIRSNMKNNDMNNKSVTHNYIFFGIFVCLDSSNNPVEYLEQEFSTKPVPRFPLSTKLSLKSIKCHVNGSTRTLSTSYITRD